MPQVDVDWEVEAPGKRLEVIVGVISDLISVLAFLLAGVVIDSMIGPMVSRRIPE